jgi:nucleoside 2-deoxyribosyltransferase
MGINKAPEKCHLTDMPTENILSAVDAIEYFVIFSGMRYFFVFDWNHSNSEYVEKNKHIIKGLLINDKFPYTEDNYYNNDILEKIINQVQLPRTPKAKLDNLILTLHAHQEYEGAVIDLKKNYDWGVFLFKLYFKNQKEYWFYLKTLKENGFITFIDTSSKDGNDAIDIKLTFQGLNYVIEIQENGENSRNCFVAMSFSESALEIRKTIKSVLIETGYNPLLIDELHYDRELTINDAIVRYIKKSKFLIADFTDQKHGVYFEAGFGFGQKKPVIFTCSENDFKNSHFDTNHYPHIVYKNLNDLHEKLRNKIEAWVE